MCSCYKIYIRNETTDNLLSVTIQTVSVLQFNENKICACSVTHPKFPKNYEECANIFKYHLLYTQKLSIWSNYSNHK